MLELQAEFVLRPRLTSMTDKKIPTFWMVIVTFFEQYYPVCILDILFKLYDCDMIHVLLYMIDWFSLVLKSTG